MRLHHIGIAALLASACATTKPADSENLSAAAHRRQAQAERARAEDAMARMQVTSSGVYFAGPPGSSDAPRLYPLDLYPYNSTGNALDDAERHLRHARKHEAAANALEQFEANECGAFTPAARAACPLLGPVAAVEDRADGVHLAFAAGTDVAPICAHMRCHLAFARARGFADAGDCPLYMQGVEINASKDGRGVDIVSRNPSVVKKIHAEARVISQPQPPTR